MCEHENLNVTRYKYIKERVTVECNNQLFVRYIRPENILTEEIIDVDCVCGWGKRYKNNDVPEWIVDLFKYLDIVNNNMEY